MVGPFVAEFTIIGVCSERRELKSTKNPNSDWRGYVLKVQGLGSTYEVNASKELFEKCPPMQLLKFTGGIEIVSGMTKLNCTEFIPVDGKRAVG